MKSCYIERSSESELFAIADVTDYYGEGKIITRINVPEKHRCLGYASRVLKQILTDADNEQMTLFLEIVPTEGHSYEELKDWFKRHGFKSHRGIYRRKPATI